MLTRLTMSKANSFKDFASRNKPLIDDRIASLMQDQVKASHDVDLAYADICQQLQKLIGRGGKRLRPLLCLLAYEGYDGKNKRAAMQVAVGQELLHTFLLIHDDIIDRDLMRWGGLNITGVYFDQYAKHMTPANALHYAQSQALLAGDICWSLANQQLLGSDFKPPVIIQATQLQQTVVQQVIAGEIAETTFAHAQKLTENDILRMYRYKTASYSFSLPLKLGTLIAGAPASELKLLADLADSLGIAFQLQDDLLGVFGDEIVTGKSNKGDLREGKRTVLVYKALELTSGSQRTQLLNTLGQTKATDELLDKSRQIIIDCGARQYVEAQISHYADRAQDQLAKTSLSSLAKARLVSLIALLAHRDH